MQRVTFPVPGAIVNTTVPQDVPIEAIGRMVRTALNAVWAQIAKKRPKPSGPYATGVMKRALVAWTDGRWAEFESRAAQEEQSLERNSSDRMTVDLELWIPLLVEGDEEADVRLAVWGSQLLGHAFGHGADCRACQALADHRYELMLRLLGVQQATIANFVNVVMRGGLIDQETVARRKSRDAHAKRAAIDPDDLPF